MRGKVKKISPIADPVSTYKGYGKGLGQSHGVGKNLKIVVLLRKYSIILN